jgi:hypothetical protein
VAETSSIVGRTISHYTVLEKVGGGGMGGNWTGLGPGETPLLVRDASIQEIYVLDWETP